MGIFDPNNVIFRTLARMVDIVGLSLLWTGLTLMIIPAGPATAALYHTVVRAFREGDDSVFFRYVKSLRTNLKVGIAAGLICTVLGFILVLGFEIMYAHRATGMQAMAYAIYYVVMVLPLGVACYLFPLLGRFTFSLKELFVTALQLTLAHLPTTVIVVLLTAEGVVYMINHIWAFTFAPVILMFLTSLFLEPVFQKHMPEQ